MYNINIEAVISAQDIEDILSIAFYKWEDQCGIGYWALLENDTEEWEAYASNGGTTSEIATRMLVDGKSIIFYVTESDDYNIDEAFILDLPKLLKGIETYILETGNLNIMDNLDRNVADQIIQYALFDELVYE
jgi:hypothetical protein